MAEHSGLLSLDDIVDLRAYEREREDLRKSIIALKARRRVAVGPLVSLVFENRETVRFQIQEMARAEKIISDDAIQIELDTYNALIPTDGQLSATLFIELRNDDELRKWLPELVGIEKSVLIRFGGQVVASIPEAAHELALSRPDVTAAVHYLRFAFDADEVDTFVKEPATIEVDLPSYRHTVDLTDDTKSELIADLSGDQLGRAHS